MKSLKRLKFILLVCLNSLFYEALFDLNGLYLLKLISNKLIFGL